MHNTIPFPVTLMVSAAVALLSQAETLADNKTNAPQQKPPEGLFYDGYARNRYEFTEWHVPEYLHRDATFDDLKAQIGGGYRTATLEAYAQAQFFGGFHIPDKTGGPGQTYYLLNPDEYFTSVGYRQAYVSFKQSGQNPVTAKVGRFLFSSGEEVASKDAAVSWLQSFRVAQRLIGVSDYNVGRSFSGVRLDRNDGPHTVTLSFTHPSQGVSEANINPTITKVDIATAAYTYSEGSLEAQGFFYYYGDGRGIAPIDNRTAEERDRDRSFINIYTYGGSAVKVFGLGDDQFLDTVAWGAVQSGNWGNLEHQAAAGVLEAGYQFRGVPWQPWLRAGWNYGSGDRNTTDNKHTTFSQLIPTARRYAQTPIYNMQNNNDLFIQAIVKPTNALRVRSDLHYLELSSNKDFLYFGAGPNVKDKYFGMGGLPSGGAYNIGVLLDADISYQFTEMLSSGVYVGHVFPEGVLQADFPAGRQSVTYAFWEVILKF